MHGIEKKRSKAMVSSPISLEAKAPISVIIPCYNCATTILRAVRSVAEQTQKPYELILINDGSQDDTGDILKSLQGEFGEDWIKIIELPQNRGPSYARNAGWDAALCPYIAFLDSDDSWHPEKLAIQYGYMTSHPDVALTGHRWILVKDDSRISGMLPEELRVEPISKFKIMQRSFFATPTVMLKRRLSSRFPEDMKYSEDRFLYMKIIFEGNKAAYIDLPLAYLYKAPYGQGGLTKSIWNTEKGELDGFVRLYGIDLLDKGELLFCVVFSIMKYIRRIFLVKFRSIIEDASNK